MLDIESLTVGEVRKLQDLLPRGARKVERDELPFKVGDCVIIRTVTMIQLGRVSRIGRDFFVLEDGGWVADTGRFGELLAKGASVLGEFEKLPSWMLVGRGAVVDVFPWDHELPKATK